MSPTKCACVGERASERERESACVCPLGVVLCPPLCVRVCERESKREREREIVCVHWV